MKILTWMQNDEDEDRTIDVMVTVTEPELLRRRWEALDRGIDELAPEDVGVRVSRVRCPALHPVVDGVAYRLEWAIPKGADPPVRWRVVRSLTGDIDIYLMPGSMDLHYVDMGRFEEWEAHVDPELLTGELKRKLYRVDLP